MYGQSSGSSLSARIADSFQRQYGRPATASDPAYGTFARTEMARLQQADADALARSQRNLNRVKNAAYVAAAVPFAAAALPALGMGGGAQGGLGMRNTGTWVTGVGAAPPLSSAAAKAVTAGQYGMKAAELGIGTLGNIYGSRVAQKSNREALAAQQRASDQAMEMERARQAIEDTRYAEQQQILADQRKLEAERYAAQQAYQERMFASQESERMATQAERAANRKLIDDREARRAPYRAASAAALERLPGIIASGRTSPGLGSLGSYRG